MGETEMSSLVSGELQRIVDGLPTGNYFIRVSVFYRYFLLPNSTVSLPITLTNLALVLAPSTIGSCFDDESSLACILSGTMKLWYHNNRPVSGDFVLDFQFFKPNGILIKESKGFLIKSDS